MSITNDSPDRWPGVPEWAVDACEGRGLDYARNYGAASVAAVHPTTAAELVAWMSTPEAGGFAAPDYVALPPSEQVALCYYDGEFRIKHSTPPQPKGAKPPRPYTRIALIVTKDRVRLHMAGMVESLSLQDAPGLA